MKYPCGIIRDLLPLYIDDVCNQESRSAVEEHLLECAACRKCCEVMMGMDCTVENNDSHLQDLDSANSLKCIKKRINKRILKIVCSVVAAALICITGYHLLFNAAVKDVPLESISISANVYAVEELLQNAEAGADGADSVTISADKDDNSEPVAVSIPDIGGALINISTRTLEQYDYVSVASVKSDYFLRNIEKERVDDTIYISAIKTTLLNNKATIFQTNICGLEFGEINRIIFKDGDGTETVLWSR